MTTMATTIRPTIRPMLPRDVAPAAEAIRRGDFGEREQFLAWSLDQPTIAPFVAVDGREVVATGIASAHGPVGWVGVIFVAPDRRGTGLGRAITRRVLEELEARGCHSQVLIASPMGRPIYEREGFRELGRQVRFTAEPIDGDAGRFAAERLRSFRADDLDAILELDRGATGEDRSAVLRVLVDASSTWLTVDAADRPTGFFLRPPWRGGAVIARDPDDALVLLELRRRQTSSHGHAGAGVLASNETGRARLRAAGWHEEVANVRMLRGEPLDWDANAIWGQLNGALG
jgi:GNAT superfamily N-acetyltransferase